MTEIYELPQGKIVIAHSDKKLSTGLLILKPNTEYPKHNRPVLEQLTQIKGSCVMKIFDEADKDKLVKEVTLKENEQLKIKANQFHVHTNPFDKESITSWAFEGDIADIIDSIRKNPANKKLA